MNPNCPTKLAHTPHQFTLPVLTNFSRVERTTFPMWCDGVDYTNIDINKRHPSYVPPNNIKLTTMEATLALDNHLIKTIPNVDAREDAIDSLIVVFKACGLLWRQDDGMAEYPLVERTNNVTPLRRRADRSAYEMKEPQ